MDMRHGGFEKVVSLFGKAAPLTFSAINQVDAYWEGLRAGRLMPDRSEVDPRGLGASLEYAFLLEHVAPGIGRVRISGMHLRDLLGMEVRGMPLTAFFVPEARERVSKALEQVVTGPKVADIRLSSAPGIGKPRLEARLYMAPLSNAGDQATRVLCCLESRGEIGRSPRRFTVDQVQVRRIVATAGAPVLTDPVPGLAETPAPYTPSPAPQAPETAGADASAAPKRELPPYLRLVKND